MAEFATSDGVKLHYEERGAGAPIVFVHGWMMSGAFWRRQVEGLSSRRRTITWDLRGCGESGNRPGSIRLARFAVDLHELLEHLDVTGATLVGWSLGGGITMAYLNEHGTRRVRAVGLVDFPPRFREAPEVADKVCHNLDKRGAAFRREFLKRMFHAEPLEVDLAWMMAENAKCDNETACATYRQLRETGSPEPARPFPIPALLAFPDHGWYPSSRDEWKPVFPRHLAPAFPRSRHCPFLEEPEAFNRAVLEVSG